MFYYSCYSCRGLAALAYDLNVNDPFALAPAEIVERILMAGYTPAVKLARHVLSPRRCFEPEAHARLIPVRELDAG